jgi:hypothetical protein
VVAVSSDESVAVFKGVEQRTHSSDEGGESAPQAEQIIETLADRQTFSRCYTY